MVLVYQEAVLVVEIKVIAAFAKNAISCINIPGILEEIFVFGIILDTTIIIKVFGGVIFNVGLAARIKRNLGIVRII